MSAWIVDDDDDYGNKKDTGDGNDDDSQCGLVERIAWLGAMVCLRGSSVGVVRNEVLARQWWPGNKLVSHIQFDVILWCNAQL